MKKLRSLLYSATTCAGLLASFAATAELPSHPMVQVLRPTNAEVSNGAAAPPNAFFGDAIAVYKSVALVGMPDTSTGSLMQTGRVAVFTRRDGVWVRTGTFVSPSPRQGARFGQLISLENDTALIADSNTVYVFKYSTATGWKVVQWIHPPKDDPVVQYPLTLQYRCGNAIATAFTQNASIVYLYERLSDGRFAFKKRLLPRFDGETFGASVAVDCNIAVVGGPAYRNPTTDPGSAYIYRKTNGVWGGTEQLIPYDGVGGDAFGSAVAIDQQNIFVGARNASGSVTYDPETAQGGAVYIYSLASNGFYTQTARLHPSLSDHNAYTFFGNGIRVTKDRLLVQAYEYNFGGVSMRMENLVFTYTRSGGTATPLGIARGVVEGGDFFASGARIFVGTPDDDRCFECIGKVNIYDLTTTE